MAAQVEQRPLDLRDLAAHGRTTGASSRRAGWLWSTALPEGALWIEGDATRLAQVIGNPALELGQVYLRRDSVRLSLDADDGFAVLRVRDTGRASTLR